MLIVLSGMLHHSVSITKTRLLIKKNLNVIIIWLDKMESQINIIKFKEDLHKKVEVK